MVREELDPLTEKQQKLITILELVRIEQFLPTLLDLKGVPKKHGLLSPDHLLLKWCIISIIPLL